MKSNRTVIVLVICVLVLPMFFSCSIFEGLLRDSVRDSVRGDSGTTAESADSGSKGSSGKGEAKAERAQPDPQWNNLMINQARMIFPMAFAGGGFHVGQRDYMPGDYTIFEWVSDNDDPVSMEKAYLLKTDDGKEWWRVAWTVEGDTWIYEMLLDPATESMVRLRARDMDGVTGEIPVTDQSFYIPPAELTEESVSGATVGTETVTTPAGSFRAEHVVFMGITGDGDMEWWLSTDVPGGVVKYRLAEGKSAEIWSSELIEYGSDAATMLDSY